MKQVCVFLLCVTLFQRNSVWINVERDKLNYEVLSMTFTNEEVVVKGWGVMPYNQHFYGNSTHNYEIEIVGKTHVIYQQAELQNIDLTHQMEYQGFSKCSENQLLSSSCNYNFMNVVFEFRLPLSSFKIDEEYSMYLKMHATTTNTKYRIPLFYVQKEETIQTIGRKKFTILSSFEHTKFQVYVENLFARSGPSPHSNYVNTSYSCSMQYGNTNYFKHNEYFNHIRGVELYDGLISYFMVMVNAVGCVNFRQRLTEATSNGFLTYIPSTGVNYVGPPTKILVTHNNTKPVLYIEDINLNENDTYDPYKYVRAVDAFDGDLTNAILVKSTNVDVNTPGSYITCYSVQNSLNNEEYGCGNVEINRLPRKSRYISTYTIHDTQLKIWNRNELKKRIRKGEGILKRFLLFN